MSRWRGHANRWARDRRDELYLLMGGACRRCDATRGLQFDHIVSCGWVPSAHSWAQRMIEYGRALRAGNLQLLCARCHARKTRESGIDTAVPEDMQPY